MKLKISTLFLLVILCFQARTQLISFKNFGLDRGVFPSRIECISQTSSGELCVGTLAGLVVYNGEEFITLNEDHGLAENAVSTIFRDGDTLWIGHWAGNVTALNTIDKSTRVFNIGQQLKYSSIVAVHKGSNGDLWFINKNGELFRYDKKAVIQMSIPELRSGEKAIDFISSQDKMYLLTTNRLLHLELDPEGITWDVVYRSDQEIAAAMPLQSSKWLFALQNSIEVYDRSNKGIVRVLDIPMARVTDITQDLEEYVWIGTANSGIIKYHPVTGEVQRISRDNGLSYNEVRSLFLDREGQIWVATGAGLDQYLGSAFRLIHSKAGIPNGLVWDFQHTADQTLLATEGGLYSIELNGNRVSNQVEIEIGNETPYHICNTPNFAYVVTAEGNVWYGSNTEAFRMIPIDEYATCIEQVDSQIWVGTKDGIVILSNNQPYEQYTAESGLGGNYVNGIYHNEALSQTWITALGAPITMYSNGGFQQFEEANGITSKVIQDVDFDSKGNPWFATYDKGVFYRDADSIHNVSSIVDLSSESTFAIEIDSMDNVWIGHNSGIDCFEPAKGNVRRFGVEKGFLGVEVNSGAMSIGADGVLRAGTLMGLLEFNPRLVRTNISEPEVRISKATMADVPLVAGAENEIRADLSVSTFKVNLSAISLTDPSNMTVKYRLIGVHDAWRTQTGQKSIEYVSLAPGDFTFELIACNSDGVCNVNATQLTFSVLAPFYRSWWFYTIIFLAFLVFLYLMDRFRLLSIVDERNLLKEKIANLNDSVIDMEGRLNDYAIEKNSCVNMINSIGVEGWSLNQEPPTSWNKFIGTRSANHVLGVDLGKYRLVGIIDVNHHTAASDFIFQHIIGQLSDLDVSQISSISELQKQVSMIAQNVQEQSDQNPRINWAIVGLDKVSNQVSLSTYGAQAYHLTDSVVNDYSAKTNDQTRLVSIEASGKILLSSKGYVEQLSNDGTRSFSGKRLFQAIEKNRSKPSEELLGSLKEMHFEWKADMDQTDDIMMMIWNL